MDDKDLLNNSTQNSDSTPIVDEREKLVTELEQLKELRNKIAQEVQKDYTPKEIDTTNKESVEKGIIDLDERINQLEQENKALAKQYEESYKRLQEIIDKEEQELNVDGLLTSEDIQEIINKYSELKLEENKKSLEIKKQLDSRKKYISTLKGKKTKLQNTIIKAEALGLDLEEYEDLTSTLRKKNLMNAILKEKGLEEITLKKAKERTKEEKALLKSAREEIKQEVGKYKSENKISALNSINILYGLDTVSMGNKKGVKVITLSLEEIENIKKIKQNEPIKIINTLKVVSYVPDKEPEDMIVGTEPKEKITLYKNDKNNYFASRVTLQRFGLVENGEKTKINGIDCYEISEEEYEKIINNKDNETSPYRINLVEAMGSVEPSITSDEIKNHIIEEINKSNEVQDTQLPESIKQEINTIKEEGLNNPENPIISEKVQQIIEDFEIERQKADEEEKENSVREVVEDLETERKNESTMGNTESSRKIQQVIEDFEIERQKVDEEEKAKKENSVREVVEDFETQRKNESTTENKEPSEKIQQVIEDFEAERRKVDEEEEEKKKGTVSTIPQEINNKAQKISTQQQAPKKITVYQDGNDYYISKSTIDRFNLYQGNDKKEIDGETYYKVSIDAYEYIASKKNTSPTFDINLIKINETTQTQQTPITSPSTIQNNTTQPPRRSPYHVEEIIEELTKDLNIKANDSDRYIASNIKVSEKFKEELKTGNYAYNVVHIIPNIYRAIIDFGKKLIAKLLLSDESKKSMAEVEKRLNELAEEKVDTLFEEYNGYQLKVDMNNQINSLIIARLKKHAYDKIETLNQEIKHSYANLFVVLGQVKELDAEKNKDNRDKLMKQASDYVVSILDLRRAAHYYLSSGIKGIEQEYEEVAKKNPYIGLSFAKSNDFNNELQSELAKYGKGLQEGLYNDNPEEIVSNFVKLETCYRSNTKVSNSVFGKISTGDKHHGEKEDAEIGKILDEYIEQEEKGKAK